MLVIEPSPAMWFTFALIAVTMVLFAWERYPIELVGFASIVTLLFAFHLFPVLDANGDNRLGAQALLSGFANPALLSVLALMVVGQAMVRTYALESVVKWVLSLTGSHWRWSVWAMFALALVLSGFVNNTPIVVIFIPVLQAVAMELRVSASKMMMRLNMAAILGGMTTVIGSSTNLLAAGIFETMTGEAVGIFDITPIGVVLALVGLAYILFVAPRLLVDRASMAASMIAESGRQYLAQIVIDERSSLIGQRGHATGFPGLPDISVHFVQRGEHAELPTFESFALAPGDVLVVAATRKALSDAMMRDRGLIVEMDSDPSAETDRRPATQRVVAEVMIAPASRMIGLNLEMIGFRRLFSCIVVGIQRRSRMIRAKLTEIRLEAGDVLLIQGHRHDVRALRGNQDLVLMEWSQTELPTPHLARRVGLIFLVMLALISAEVVPTVVAALGAAVATMLVRALNVRQAARAIDRRIIVLIVTSIALSMALEATRGSEYLAATMIATVGVNAAPAVLLSGFFFMVMVMTNFLSNNATALLFTPIGIGLAQSLGVDPLLFLMASIFASDSSFATPIGYQTNVLVMGPGHYRFIDYLRAGLPLNILLWIVFTVVASLAYGLF
ncbi:MAG: SLC13 family permease [Alphaproteobacteria bacterium]|nr:SLC13 family permease [Alphaproteobacteria bacterium]